MARRGMAALLAFCMVLGLTACGGESDDTVTTTAVTTTTATEADTTTISTEDGVTTDKTVETPTTVQKNDPTVGKTTTTVKPTDKVTTTKEEKTTTKTTTTAKPTATTTGKVTEKTTTTSMSTTTTQPTHVHTFADATCEKPKTCACGAIEGEAFGHDYRYFICKRCKTQEQGTFVNLNDYFWKYGEVEFNTDGESPAIMASIIRLDFKNKDYNDAGCFGDSEITFDNMDDYKDRPSFSYTRIYDYHVYEMAADGAASFEFTETDTHVSITFLEYSGEIKLEKKGKGVLKVVSNTFKAYFAIEVPVGAEFTAYPRWGD